MNREPTPTEQLVRSAQDGDVQAFRALYDRFSDRVFRTAVRLLGERTEAEDVTQEIFVTMYEKLGEFSYRSSFSTWVYRITVNACYAVLRKRERRGKYHDRDQTIDDLAPSSLEPAPDRTADSNEVGYYLERAIERLSDDLRATFVLRQMEGLTYDEVAQVLDISSGTVASRLARARSHLAATLRDLGVDESYL